MKKRLLPENIQEKIDALTKKVEEDLFSEPDLKIVMTILMGSLHRCIECFSNDSDRQKLRDMVIDIMSQDLHEKMA